MVHVKDHKLRDMFNSLALLALKRHAVLKSPRAHLFREETQHNLQAEKLIRFYDEFQGRKSKELYVMFGLPSFSKLKSVHTNRLLNKTGILPD